MGPPIDPAKRYEGNPCRKCGGTTRYRYDGHCTSCGANRKRELSSTRREAARAPRMAAPPPPPPVATSSFIAPLTRAQLMAGR